MPYQAVHQGFPPLTTLDDHQEREPVQLIANPFAFQDNGVRRDNDQSLAQTVTPACDNRSNRQRKPAKQ